MLALSPVNDDRVPITIGSYYLESSFVKHFSLQFQYVTCHPCFTPLPSSAEPKDAAPPTQVFGDDSDKAPSMM